MFNNIIPTVCISTIPSIETIETIISNYMDNLFITYICGMDGWTTRYNLAQDS